MVTSLLEDLMVTFVWRFHTRRDSGRLRGYKPKVPVVGMEELVVEKLEVKAFAAARVLVTTTCAEKEADTALLVPLPIED